MNRSNSEPGKQIKEGVFLTLVHPGIVYRGQHAGADYGNTK